MLRRKGMATTVAGLVLVGLNAVASAGSITFSTAKVVESQGNSSVTYTPNATNPQTFVYDDVLGGSFSVVFGTLTATAGNSNSDFNGMLLSIPLTQTSPTSGTGDFTATLTGKLKYNTDTVTVDWQDVSFQLPNPSATTGPTVHYTLNVADIVFQRPAGGGSLGPVNLTGTVSVTITSDVQIEQGPTVAVPLPASAWGGMTLLGLLGAAKVLRRQGQSA